MQGPVFDPVQGGSHLCGFRRPVPPQNLLKTFLGNGEGDCSGQKCSGSGENLVLATEGHQSGFKRAGSMENAELVSPKKSKQSFSDTGHISSCSSDLCSESNGCLVYIHHATDGKDSSDLESIYSIQSKVTEIVKDSSDDLWFLEEDADSDQFSVDVYADEFEVMSERYSESDSDVDSILTSQEDVIVICEESDLEFFADCEWSNIDGDSSDDDLLQGDKWLCSICEHMNGPLHRFCESCWTLRPNWLPKSSPSKQLLHDETFEKKDCQSLCFPDDVHAKDERNLKVQSFINSSDIQCKEEHMDEGQNRSKVSVVEADNNGTISQGLPSTQDSGFDTSQMNSLSSSQAQSVTASSSDGSLAVSNKSPIDCFNVSNSTPDGETRTLALPSSTVASYHVSSGSCIICLSQPKEATIVHGSTGHQSCCYRCARRLKRCKKPCPVCRRDIQKVVRNYFV